MCHFVHVKSVVGFCGKVALIKLAGERSRFCVTSGLMSFKAVDIGIIFRASNAFDRWRNWVRMLKPMSQVRSFIPIISVAFSTAKTFCTQMFNQMPRDCCFVLEFAGTKIASKVFRLIWIGLSVFFEFAC